MGSLEASERVVPHPHGGVVPAAGKPPLIPAPHAVKLLPAPLPAGTDPVYAGRYYAALSGLSVALVPYTPADAAWILEHRNGRNRPMRSSWRGIRSRIKDHLWQVNGETAIFDANGIVLSAQHRLRAIAEGDQVVPMLTVYGVDPAAFATLDQGSRRNGRDVMALLDKDDAATFAVALAWAQRYAEGITRGPWQTIPNERLEDVLANYPDMPASVRYGASKRKTRVLHASLLAFLHHALYECDPAAAGPYLERVVDGIDVAANSWEFVLRTRLNSEFKDTPRFFDRLHALALCFKAFNYSRSGRPVVAPVRAGKPIAPSISWRYDQGEPFPELEAPREAWREIG